MVDYFKSRRTKIGVGTLVLTCVLAMGWVRSFSLNDAVVYQDHRFYVSSLDGKIALGSVTPRGESSVDGIWWEVRINVNDPGNPSGPPVPDLTWLGIEGFSASGAWWLAVPYWLLVGPLTMTSAWFLLSKSGETEFKTAIEPIPQTLA